MIRSDWERHLFAGLQQPSSYEQRPRAPEGLDQCAIDLRPASALTATTL